MISVVINADNREGYLNETSTVGDYGSGSLQGVRSKDLLIDGLKNKLKFFEGYDIQCIFYLDVHEPLPSKLHEEIKQIVFACGNDSKIVLNPHSKVKYKWNDWLYIDALKLADGDYVAHFDNDCCAYKKEGSDIVEQYFRWLDNGYKYVCQSWDGIGDEMYWASTRFFICKKETLDLSLAEVLIYKNPLQGKNNPCFESTIGLMAGEGNVLYPPRDDDNYIVFCWAKYFSGLMKTLNNLPYEDAVKYIKGCGLYGSHDVIAKPIEL